MASRVYRFDRKEIAVQKILVAYCTYNTAQHKSYMYLIYHVPHYTVNLNISMYGAIHILITRFL